MITIDCRHRALFRASMRVMSASLLLWLAGCEGCNDCPEGGCVTGRGELCKNGELDDGETDVDCGGLVCARCDAGKTCVKKSDCASKVCDQMTHTCAEAGVPAPTDMPDPMPNMDIPVCTCSAQPGDGDGDCEPDVLEDKNGNGSYDVGSDFADSHNPDTDGDGVLDGCEDIGHDGVTTAAETSPASGDSDGDGIPDGLEDRNKNGYCDIRPELAVEESCAYLTDSDHDGIVDNLEDRNLNGVWDCPEDPNSLPCETHGARADTDGDGLADVTELRSLVRTDSPNFEFCVIAGPDPCGGIADYRCRDRLNPTVAPTFAGVDGLVGFDTTTMINDDQTCPWFADSDEDGISDGNEDQNGDGVRNGGESDPRITDTDGDGLVDGMEDTDHDGVWNPETETDPSRIDTDGDGIGDAVEDSGGCLTITSVMGASCSGDPVSTVGARSPCNCALWRNGVHDANESDPRFEDTDEDGLKDGAEDRNGDGVCQLPRNADFPRATDETCAYLGDSDGDNLADGAEDLNNNGVVDRALNETDARRADPDNDCLNDTYEIFSTTDPFTADSDDDGLADGIETGELNDRKRFNAATGECELIVCASGVRYQSATCPNPLIRDSDGDGLADGGENLNGFMTGEDANADGCTISPETSPCAQDAVPQPEIGSTTPGDWRCYLDTSTTSPPANPALCSSPVCPDSGAWDTPNCQQARKAGQALVCADGNIRPLVVLRSAEADYAFALPAKADADGVPRSLFDSADIKLGDTKIGHGFQSDDERSDPDDQTVGERIRSVFGAITRLGTLRVSATLDPDEVLDDPPLTIVDGTGSGPIVANSNLTPSDVASAAEARIRAKLEALGYIYVRTAGGNVAAWDDRSGTGDPTATQVTRAIDRYLVRRAGGGDVDGDEIKRAVVSGVVGGNTLTEQQPEPNNPLPVTKTAAELKVLYYKRIVQAREFATDGTSALVPRAYFGAVLAVGVIDADCSVIVGPDRALCRERNEPALIPVDDLTNGSALARFQSELGRDCSAFEPQKAKADFLMVIDDSGSMQEYILAVQQATRDIAFKLRANANNLDWRIGMTTSNMGFSIGGVKDDYVPGPSGYPQHPGAAAHSTEAGWFAAYQATAYDANGNVADCIYADDYDPFEPRKSPYCCTNAIGADPLGYVTTCCSLPSGQTKPTPYLSAGFDLTGTGTLASPFENRNTLRCWDFPRMSEDRQGWGANVPAYWGTSPNTNPSPVQRTRHFNDYLCGADLGGGFYPMPLWGTRGYLWPPGFTGNDPTNARLDGASLLIRNADMLVIQMNRDCEQVNTGGDQRSPRRRNGSGQETPLQAAKRAVERATTNGRTGGATSLRADAPLITIIVSDEEDWATKAMPQGSSSPQDRDGNQLPPARCVGNGDLGCTLEYCEGCLGAAIDTSFASDTAIPGARTYKNGMIERDTKTGSYCVSPATNLASVTADCDTTNFCGGSPAQATPFCSALQAGTVPNQRYNGFGRVACGEDENLDGAQQEQANAAPADSLNYKNDSWTCSASCSGVSRPVSEASFDGDCLPCARFLREKQYIDFFGGACSPLSITNPTQPPPPEDPRRYPRPAATVSSGNLALPLGPVFAITRLPGRHGGAAGSCGSSYNGGDGQAFRDVAIATGGRVADICPPPGETVPAFADFLDTVLIEAQGLGSAYVLRGNPISSTIRVGVMDQNGTLRMLKRSSVSGFDYNPTTNTIVFISKSVEDEANQFTNIDKPNLTRDAVAYVSYRVWNQRCGDCAAGDLCTICTCSIGNPECCGPDTIYQCQSPIICPQGCGPCEECNANTNTCQPADPCSQCGAVCSTTSTGPQCQSCPAGTTPVVVPCEPGSESLCPDTPLTVCVSSGGLPNLGGSCAVTALPNDCCGVDKPCPIGEVCVIHPCLGESCLPTATCEMPSSGQPDSSWCCPTLSPPGTQCCPDGTVCAPKPCQGESCSPEFVCISDSLGQSNTSQCEPVCNCGPTGLCNQCPTGKKCDAGQCVDICANMPPELCCIEQQCCGPYETFNPVTKTCDPGCFQCPETCGPDSFCDTQLCRCVLKGG